MNNIEQYVNENFSKYATNHIGKLTSIDGYIKQIEYVVKFGKTSGLLFVLVKSGNNFNVKSLPFNLLETK